MNPSATLRRRCAAPGSFILLLGAASPSIPKPISVFFSRVVAVAAAATTPFAAPASSTAGAHVATAAVPARPSAAAAARLPAEPSVRSSAPHRQCGCSSGIGFGLLFCYVLCSAGLLAISLQIHLSGGICCSIPCRRSACKSAAADVLLPILPAAQDWSSAGILLCCLEAIGFLCPPASQST